LNAEVGPKRLEPLHELIPAATVIGLLVNPTNPNLAKPTTKNLHAAAHSLGLEMHVLHASAERDFDTVFATPQPLRACEDGQGPRRPHPGQSWNVQLRVAWSGDARRISRVNVARQLQPL
jgi:hypothetical protein